MNMTLAEFWDALKRHDWYYMMSDDSRVYRKGAAENMRLHGFAKKHGGEYLALWKAFSDRSCENPERPA